VVSVHANPTSLAVVVINALLVLLDLGQKVALHVSATLLVRSTTSAIVQLDSVVADPTPMAEFVTSANQDIGTVIDFFKIEK
jgi:hypothetical protein